MRATVVRVARGHLFAVLDDGQRFFVPGTECAFVVDEAWLGDILDIEEVFEGSEGLRGRGAVFIERPTRPLVTATIKTIRSDRGFAFAAQDHGPDLFLPISEFADFDIESSTSATFARLTRGDRIHAECIPGHPNPVGIRIAACAAAVAQDETGR